ncbi:MAG TPA: serine hydrolase domain-containing protein [Verrucomicrobiae bacterium]|jgi:hypothetical protein|nr:serine hydrolase domain-containing protein [Verrucomicrobiae bacterium]
MKKVILLIIALLAGTGSLATDSKGLPHTRPDVEGFSAERLERLHQIVNGFVESGQHAGVVTLLARDGKIVDTGAYGYADVEKKNPMRQDTICRISRTGSGSASKSSTISASAAFSDRPTPSVGTARRRLTAELTATNGLSRLLSPGTFLLTSIGSSRNLPTAIIKRRSMRRNSRGRTLRARCALALSVGAFHEQNESL